jgi:hypothetical protein
VTRFFASVGRLSELVTDPADGRLSWSRCGAIIAGTTYTYFLAVELPHDWLLWAIYMVTVGGYVVLLKFLHMRYGGGGSPSNGVADHVDQDSTDDACADCPVRKKRRR